MPIEVKHLTHIYAPGTPFESRAVDDVSFTVNDGDFVGLIGHTGSGKSTLIQHLNALLKPAGGQVLVDGEDIHQPGRSLSARLKVGLVFQYPEYQLFEETVRKDVGFGPRNLGLSDAEVDARVSEALRRVGLSEGDWEKSPFEFFASPYEGRRTRQRSSALMGTPPVATGRQRIRFTHIGRMLLMVHLIRSITSNIIPCRKKYQRSPLLLCVAKASVNRSENRTA